MYAICCLLCCSFCNGFGSNTCWFLFSQWFSDTVSIICEFFLFSVVPAYFLLHLLFLSTVCLFIMWSFRSWNDCIKLGLFLVPGYFRLIYQLFKPMSVSFVFWSLLGRRCLTLSLHLCCSFVLVEVREWLCHCVWLNNNCTEYLFPYANIKTLLLAP